MNVKIDILMATYNGEKHVCAQIESILRQTYSNFNLIICDDMSTDKTPFLINRYARKYPHKIKVIKADRKYGSSQCFSFLLEHSESPYVMFADQDDVWFVNKIARLIEEIKGLEEQHGSHVPALVHSDLVVVDEKLRVISQSFWQYSHLFPEKGTSLNRLLVQNVVTGCATIVNRAAVLEATPIPENVIQHDWWLALVTASVGHIKSIDSQLISYRQHGNNSVGATKYNALDYWKRIIDSSSVVKSYQKNQKQAIALRSRLSAKLSTQQNEVIENFLKLDCRNLFKVIFTCVKYGFYFHGSTRNIAAFAKRVRQLVLVKILRMAVVES